MLRVGIVMCAVAGIAACATAPSETTPVLPTPFPEVATTPELQAWTTSRILDFRTTQNEDSFIGFGLEVLALPAAIESAESNASALVISAAEPPSGWFATPLHSESIALVVSVENPVRDLTEDAVSRIFTGRITNWEELGGPDLLVQPVVPLESAETRSFLQQTLFGDRLVAPTALLGPTPDNILELVGEDPGAIGIVPLSAAADSTLIAINGLNPGDLGYPWQMEILGMAPAEPSGLVRDWLAWMQADLKQDF